MLKQIKLTCALLMLLVLVLPMSSCSRNAVVDNQNQQVEVQRYLLAEHNSVLDWAAAACFLLPLLVSSCLFYGAKSSSWLGLFEIVSMLPCLLVIWAHAIMSDLASGGYLALGLCLLYALLAVADIGRSGFNTRAHSR